MENEYDGFRELGRAVALQAVYDYEAALKGNIHKRDRQRIGDVVKSCEEFFKSEWFYELCGLDGEQVMNIIKERVGRGDIEIA